MMIANTPERLTGYLRTYNQRYPDAWKWFDKFRADRVQFGDWPQWCFCPLAGSHAIISQHVLDDRNVQDIGILGALAAWRQTQGIYRFDQTIFDEIWDTPINGELPAELLLHLPEWCVYIETPNRTDDHKGMLGFFADLEYDAKDHRRELRMVLDWGYQLIPVQIHLVGSIADGFNAAHNESKRQAKKNGTAAEIAEVEKLKPTAKFIQFYEPIISTLLYLCSQAAEIRDSKGSDRQPKNPKVQKLKSGLRTVPASSQTTWNVGWRTGAALRAAREQEQSESTGNAHSSPRPHIRRAHWHHYWSGPKTGERTLTLKWQHPILVNVSLKEDQSIIPTIRPVKGI